MVGNTTELVEVNITKEATPRVADEDALMQILQEPKNKCLVKHIKIICP